MLEHRTLSLVPPHAPMLRRTVGQIADRVIGLDRIDRIYRELTPAADPREFIEASIARLGVLTELCGAGLDAIPADGPVIVVANHPFGGLDGLLLAQLLLKRRPDIRVLANRHLTRIQELKEFFIPIDVFGGKRANHGNLRGLRNALRWVDGGGLLALFPAGEVSHLDLASRGVVDPAWPDSMARIVRMSRAPVVPIHFGGMNSWLFQLSGLIHPLLRTALLPRELLNKSRRKVPISIGKPIDAARIDEMEGDDVLASHLRLSTYALAAHAGAPAPDKTRCATVPVAAPIESSELAREIAALPQTQRLASNGELAVWVTTLRQSPFLVREIGRLREVTFRSVGEGTGKSTDIDVFDSYYDQLIVWNEARQEIAGAYRLGRTDDIMARSGLRGLYTHGLFRYSRTFFDQLPPALELGRSFVREAYQRSFAPLMLLWKGIAAYIARNPRYSVLFGAVSISSDYHPLSKEFLRAYLSREHFAASLARCVRPRNRIGHSHTLKTLMRLCRGPKSIDELGALVTTLEADGKGIPVLLRQYLKLGGKIAGFNVDPDFNDAVDCLLVVDLRETDTPILEKYMGKCIAAEFLIHHAQPPCARAG